MSLLTRIASGGFKQEASLTLDQIKVLHEHDSLQEKLFPIEYGLKGLQHIEVSDDELKKDLNGQKFNSHEFQYEFEEQFVFIDNHTNKALAIYMIHPEKRTKLNRKVLTKGAIYL